MSKEIPREEAPAVMYLIGSALVRAASCSIRLGHSHTLNTIQSYIKPERIRDPNDRMALEFVRDILSAGQPKGISMEDIREKWGFIFSLLERRSSIPYDPPKAEKQGAVR